MYDRVVLDGEFSLDVQLDGEFGVVIGGGSDLPVYTGEITVTPTQETQVLETADHSVLDNITINPIPHNYGLITWDGSVLTVS